MGIDVTVKEPKGAPELEKYRVTSSPDQLNVTLVIGSSIELNQANKHVAGRIAPLILRRSFLPHGNLRRLSRLWSFLQKEKKEKKKLSLSKGLERFYSLIFGTCYAYFARYTILQ